MQRVFVSRHRFLRRNRFSFLELMVVIIIIGLLAALVAPNFMKRLEEAKVNAAKAQIKLLGNAVKDFYLDMDNYPSRLEELINDPGDDKWSGPYLDPAKIPVDPWGNNYQYNSSTGEGIFKITCYGGDGSPGGDGINADFDSQDL